VEKELADLKEILEETCLETTAKPRLGTITQREYSCARDAIEPASQISSSLQWSQRGKLLCWTDGISKYQTEED